VSYLPREAVEDAERSLVFSRELAARFPNARWNGSRWEDDVPIELCDFEFSCGTDFGARPMVHIEWFLKFAGGRVYRRRLAGFANAGFDALARDEPEVADRVRRFLRRVGA
jgi:hypothetical protein